MAIAPHLSRWLRWFDEFDRHLKPRADYVPAFALELRCDAGRYTCTLLSAALCDADKASYTSACRAYKVFAEPFWGRLAAAMKAILAQRCPEQLELFRPLGGVVT
jgi:hypothetical protein